MLGDLIVKTFDCFAPQYQRFPQEIQLLTPCGRESIAGSKSRCPRFGATRSPFPRLAFAPNGEPDRYHTGATSSPEASVASGDRERTSGTPSSVTLELDHASCALIRSTANLGLLGFVRDDRFVGGSIRSERDRRRCGTSWDGSTTCGTTLYRVGPTSPTASNL